MRESAGRSGIVNRSRFSGVRSGIISAPGSPASLCERMVALSPACRKERPSVEESDLTTPVIRALGLVVGKTVRERLGVRDVSDGSGVYRMNNFFLTSTITAACQVFIPSCLALNLVFRPVTRMKLPKRRMAERSWTFSAGASCTMHETPEIGEESVSGDGSPCGHYATGRRLLLFEFWRPAVAVCSINGEQGSRGAGEQVKCISKIKYRSSWA